MLTLHLQQVNSVRLRRHITSKDFKGSVFVEFADRDISEQVQTACRACVVQVVQHLRERLRDALAQQLFQVCITDTSMYEFSACCLVIQDTILHNAESVLLPHCVTLQIKADSGVEAEDRACRSASAP